MINGSVRAPFRRHARLLYRLYSAGLAALSHVKPLFALALRVLTHEKRPVRGRILPVGIPLGSPEQTPLAREALERLIAGSPAAGLMNECLCRSVGGCADHPHDLGCLVLGEAALSLHPGLGRQARAGEAMERVDRALGRGLVPMAVRMKSEAALWSLKGRQMMTVCFCCPCCCLMRKAAYGRKKSLLSGFPGVSVRFEADKCAGCGACAASCFSGALRMIRGEPSIDRKRCLACGRCAFVCRQGALSVVVEEGTDACAIVKEC